MVRDPEEKNSTPWSVFCICIFSYWVVYEQSNEEINIPVFFFNAMAGLICNSLFNYFSLGSKTHIKIEKSMLDLNHPKYFLLGKIRFLLGKLLLCIEMGRNSISISEQ